MRFFKRTELRLILLGLLLGLPFAAKSQIASSEPFILKVERDITAPFIQITQINEADSIKLSFYDRSGIDTIWIDQEPISVHQQTSYTIENKILPGQVYLIQAIDIRKNLTEETLVLGQGGNLMRGGKITNNISEISVINYAQYYALLIGVENYKDESIKKLYYPIHDAEKLYDVLTKNYTFDSTHIILLKNPTENEIEDAFDDLKDKVGVNDNLLIFFAGHGDWNEDSETGVWYPADARKNRSSTWVRNSTIRDYIKEINSRHTLLIADACFSGSIFDSRGTDDGEVKTYKNLYSLKSRKAMTSGTLQQVPDKSVFMKYLLKQLNQNIDHYLPAATLFSRFTPSVLNETDNVPQFGIIRDTENAGGDFIFIRKGISIEAPIN